MRSPIEQSKREMTIAMVSCWLIGLCLISSVALNAVWYSELKTASKGGGNVVFSPDSYAALLHYFKLMCFMFFPAVGVILLLAGWIIWRLRRNILASSNISN